MEAKRCIICGKKAAARINNKVWLCDECALQAIILSLKTGTPVICANRGSPQYLLIPAGGHNN